MSNQFAKLFERDGVQVLVKKDSVPDEDAGAEIRFYFKPDELGVCSVSISFPDTDEGWDAADMAFDRVDEDIAFDAIKDAMKMANELTKGEEA